jgi:hypothetical protein
LASAATAIRFPFGLDYGEGIVWQQVRSITAGRGYGDITQFPFIVFHYPPVYHVLSALVAATGLDQLAAGRLLSVLATLATSALTGALAYRAVRAGTALAPSLACGCVAGLVGFTYWPVIVWSPLMRVDMVAVALSFLGVYFGLRAPERPALVHAAAVCFVLAVYTKQTAIAAPVATFSVLLLVRPRLAVAGTATALALGLAALGGLMWATDGGFLRHILLYNINRFNAATLLGAKVAGQVAAHAGYVVVVTLVACGAVRELLRGGPQRTLVSRARESVETSERHRVLAIVVVYLVLSTLLVGMAGKSGSNLNYLIEWMCVWSVLLGVAVRDAAVLAAPFVGRPCVRALSPRPVARTVLTAMLPSVLASQAALVDTPPYWISRADGAYTRELQLLVERVRASPAPVVSDDMVVLLRAGQEVPWEPAIFDELAATGRWDETPFLAMIEAQEFGFFVTLGPRVWYTPRLARAIEKAYPRQGRCAGYVLHLPSTDVADSPACGPPPPNTAAARVGPDEGRPTSPPGGDGRTMKPVPAPARRVTSSSPAPVGPDGRGGSR